MSNDTQGWNPTQPGHEMLQFLKLEIEENGTPSVEKIKQIAEQFGTTSAKVRGAIGYYSELKPQAGSTRVCVGEACRARGALATVEQLEAQGHTISRVHCAGQCVSGPTIVQSGPASLPMAHESTQAQAIQAFISRDSVSMALGSESIAQAMGETLGEAIDIRRTGSRGLFHLEPMVEIEVDGVRHGFGPLAAEEVAGVCQAIAANDFASHSKYLGEVEQIAELKSQTRFAMARLGLVDASDIESSRAYGAYAGLSRAAELGREGVLAELKTAGLRGRGGAGFPTHFKWGAAANEASEVKYVVANADEGDAGTFIDRMLMEGDPHGLIEGMSICAQTIGATAGFVYLRSEYPTAREVLQTAIDQAREAGILGSHFDIEIAVGAGSYVCGEETALIESLEGKRGQVRARPPFPTTEGLYGKPTVVNNVLTFAIAGAILREGGEKYGQLGTEMSKGTLVAQIVGATEHPACVEVPFGGTIEQLFNQYSSLNKVAAVQIGGPLGTVFATSELSDIEVSFEGLAAADGLLGHGGFVVFNEDFNPHEEVLELMTFFRDESCGKCTPCRIGTQRALELLMRIGTDAEQSGDKELLADLDEVMSATSLCALGGMAMNPVRSAMQRWPTVFGGEGDE